MLFAVNCTDKAKSLELRLATRPAHLEYLSRFLPNLRLAGPVLSDGKPAGSLILFEAETLEDAQEFADNDPYALAGLFESVRVQPFRVVFQDGQQVA